MIDSKIEYIHVVMTRFNVGLYSESKWTHDKNGVLIDPDAWMEERFNLFEKYCLPSFKSQTIKAFEWFVGIDSKTPKRFIERLESHAKDCKQLRIVLVDKITRDFINPVANLAKSGDKKYLITTRVDNDDAISFDFIETVQKSFSPGDLLFVNLNRGYAYDVEKNQFHGMNYRSNPFVSVVENAKDAKTILGYGNHIKIKDNHSLNYIEIDDKNYWVQVIHESNLMNGVRGKLINFLDHDRFEII